MKRFHVKKGDEVVVISGSERGKRGKIIEVQTGESRVIIEGVKMIKKHTRKNQLNPQGAIVEKEGTLHISTVMLAEKYDARAAKRSGAEAPAKS
jgi:large subunit ribosomal protein L24